MEMFTCCLKSSRPQQMSIHANLHHYSIPFIMADEVSLTISPQTFAIGRSCLHCVKCSTSSGCDDSDGEECAAQFRQNRFFFVFFLHCPST